MDDLISRQALLEEYDRLHVGEPGRARKMIEDAPSARPERKNGSWNVIQGDIVICSECGMCAPESMTGCLLNRHLEPNRTNFCPNCGADMRGEKHETD